MTNQSQLQQSIRDITGTSLNYEGDWHALFDADLIPEGAFNSRLLSWINSKLLTDYTNIESAKAAFAVNRDAENWGAVISAETRNKTVAIFGDSMTAQNSASADRFEAIGYMVKLNQITGQRYDFNYGLNFGVSGDDTTEMYARIVDVTSSGADIVIVLGGANDRAAKQTAATTTEQLDNIYSDLIAAGKDVYAVTSLPRRDSSYTSAGFSAGEIIQAKADTTTVNDYIKAYSGITAIDAHAVWDDGTGQAKVDYTYDGLHPSALGALEIAKLLDAAMTPKYGVRSFALSDDNVFDNTNYSGTGGTVTSTASGVLADDYASIGSTPTGDVTDRILSKSTGQVVVIDFPTGGGTADNFRLYQRKTGTYVGQEAYFEVEIDISADKTGAGIWRTFNAELRTSSGSLSVGNDRAGTDDDNYINELRSYLISKGRNLVLRSPTMTVPSSTYVEGRCSIEANTTGGAFGCQVEYLNAQLVVI